MKWLYTRYQGTPALHFTLNQHTPLTNRQAWRTFEALQADARVRFFPEWPALDSLLRRHSDLNQPATNIWGDAYLAAYAAVNGATLITFDEGFAKYDVKTLILEPT